MSEFNLDEVAKKCVASIIYENGLYDGDFLISVCEDIFKAGAEWYAEHAPLLDESDILRVGIKEGKRLMMEKAVEAVVQKTYKYGSTMEIVTEVPKEGGFKNGDKVRVIIVKED